MPDFVLISLLIYVPVNFDTGKLNVNRTFTSRPELVSMATLKSVSLNV